MHHSPWTDEAALGLAPRRMSRRLRRYYIEPEKLSAFIADQLRARSSRGSALCHRNCHRIAKYWQVLRGAPPSVSTGKCRLRGTARDGMERAGMGELELQNR